MIVFRKNYVRLSIAMNKGVEEIAHITLSDRCFISEKLIDWYELNKRDLPWRGIDDPYKIWISEIILQQTRVNQGWNYYLRFIERFPDVESLAATEEREVLKYWQGLGYYSRARNLHRTAGMIMDDFGGKFPKDYDSILKLKGIGEYTAAAIVSFAWNKPYPVVDGNVFRFLSRLLMIAEPIDTTRGKKIFTKIAESLMDVNRSGLFNQAIMEFGALQCVPVSPVCGTCPFAEKCFAYKMSETEKYPVKLNKVAVKNRYFNYFHIKCGDYTYLKKRIQKDIWQNLYEFPVIETTEHQPFELLRIQEDFIRLFPYADKCVFRPVLENKKHVLTHRILWADFYEVVLEEEFESMGPYQKLLSSEIENYPVHRLMEIYMEKNNGKER